MSARWTPISVFATTCGSGSSSSTPVSSASSRASDAVVRELGGHGYVSYAVIGDTVNTGSRLEGQAPVGGVLIGPETYRRLPAGVMVEPMSGLRVKGKAHALEAYVLRALPV